MSTLRDHTDLRVYQNARAAAVDLYRITLGWPRAAQDLASQGRRSAFSICGNIGEGWGRRRFPRSLAASMTCAEGEAHETRVWVDLARELALIDATTAARLDRRYRIIAAQLVRMRQLAHAWVPRSERRPPSPPSRPSDLAAAQDERNPLLPPPRSSDPAAAQDERNLPLRPSRPGDHAAPDDARSHPLPPRSLPLPP